MSIVFHTFASITSSIANVPWSTSARIVSQRLRSLALKKRPLAPLARLRSAAAPRRPRRRSVAASAPSRRSSSLQRRHALRDEVLLQLGAIDRVDRQQPADHVARRQRDQHGVDAHAQPPRRVVAAGRHGASCGLRRPADRRALARAASCTRRSENSSRSRDTSAAIISATNPIASRLRADEHQHQRVVQRGRLVQVNGGLGRLPRQPRPHPHDRQVTHAQQSEHERHQARPIPASAAAAGRTA